MQPCLYLAHVSSVIICCCSVAKSCLTLCDPIGWQLARLPCPSRLPELAQTMCTESVVPSNHLILCRPLLLLLSVFPSIRVFSSESALHNRWPKYCSFSFSISPSNECSGLISFTINWFALLAVQGTLKSLPSTTVQKHQLFSAQPSLLLSLLFY